MERVETLSRLRRFPKWLLPAFGYGVAAASLVWVFSKFPFAQLGEHLRTMEWAWVAVAIAAELCVYFFDAWRWQVLLGPVGAPSFPACLQSVFVGLFANDVLPARAGEIIRCFLLSYKTEVPLSLALTSTFILRIMDGMWIVVMYLLVTYQISTHVAVNVGMWGFGSAVVLIALILLWVLFHRQHAHHFVNNTSWAARFIQLLEELHRLGHWRELGLAMAIGSLYWGMQVFAIWAIARADGFYFGASEMAFLLVVKTVGTLIPNAPANMGASQATMVYALERLFTEAPQAKILAEIIFLIQTLPLLLGGAVAVASAGFNLSDLHRHARHAHTTQRLRRRENAG